MKICDTCANDTSDYTEFHFQEKSGAVIRNTNWVLCNTCRKRAPAVRLDTLTTHVVLRPIVKTEEENHN